MSSIDKMLEALEGHTLPPTYDEEVIRCDECAGPVTRGSTIQLYFSDREVLKGKLDNFRSQRMYGECCSVGRVKYPHKGTNELIVEAEVDRNWAICDTRLKHSSPESEGYEWSPKEVWEQVMQMPYELNFVSTGGMENGPEDIVDALLLVGVDLRGIVDDEGNVVITPAKRNEIDRKIAESAEDILDGLK